MIKYVIAVITTILFTLIISCVESPVESEIIIEDTPLDSLETPLNIRVDSLAILDTVYTFQVYDTTDTGGDIVIVVYDSTLDTIMASFVAYWDTVPEASMYIVYVHYSNGNYVRTLITDTTRMFVGGLVPNRSYKFNIAAALDTFKIDTIDSAGTITYDTIPVQAISEKTDFYFVSLYLPPPPENITVNAAGQTALVSWSPSIDSSLLGHKVYLYDMYGMVIDSQIVDAFTMSATFSVEENKAHKVNVITRAKIGNSEVCSTFVYDVTTVQDTVFKLPYVYLSTYEKPDDVSSTVLGAGNMIGVRGGIFAMGNIWGDTTVIDSKNGRPVHEVVVSSFYLGRSEITNALYAKYLNYLDTAVDYFTYSDTADTNAPDVTIFVYDDTLLVHDSGYIFLDSLDSINNVFNVVSGKEDYPVSGVYWKGAAAFCNWLSQEDNLTPCYDTSWILDTSTNGYRLPTEAEFEYVHSASFMGTKQRYPWGYNDRPDNYGSQITGIGTIGRFDSYYGFYDLTGNVMEWCNDWSDYLTSEDSSYYALCLLEGVCIDPPGPETGMFHLLRGGSYLVESYENTSVWRCLYPGSIFNGYGFRVARSCR